MLDDAPPPTKRMRLQTGTKSQPSVIQKENTCPNPKPDDRKRKIPAKRSAPSNVIDLNADVLLEVFDFLSIQGNKFSHFFLVVTNQNVNYRLNLKSFKFVRRSVQFGWNDQWPNGAHCWTKFQTEMQKWCAGFPKRSVWLSAVATSAQQFRPFDHIDQHFHRQLKRIPFLFLCVFFDGYSSG